MFVDELVLPGVIIEVSCRGPLGTACARFFLAIPYLYPHNLSRKQHLGKRAPEMLALRTS